MGGNMGTQQKWGLRNKPKRRFPFRYPKDLTQERSTYGLRLLLRMFKVVVLLFIVCLVWCLGFIARMANE